MKRFALVLLMLLAASPALAQTRPGTGSMVVTPCSTNQPLLGGGNGNPAGCSPGTLVLGSGKTVTVNNSLTFAGTDSTTMTFPSTSKTVMANDLSNATANTLQNVTITGAWKGNGSGVVSQAACSDLSNSAVYCSALRGQLPGTTTNDSASAGNVGEYLVSGASSLNTINTGPSSVTVSIGANAVVTWTANPYFNSGATGHGCASLVVFGGTPPTGLTATTVPYYVTCDATFTANAFHVSTSVANGVAGTTVTTSGSDGGTTAANVFSATTTSGIDFGGLTLSAGDWDVSALVHFGAAASTSVTSLFGEISGTSGAAGTAYAQIFLQNAAEVPGGTINLPTSTERISLNATTTVFCGARASFTVSTMMLGGECRARRMR